VVITGASGCESRRRGKPVRLLRRRAQRRAPLRVDPCRRFDSINPVSGGLGCNPHCAQEWFLPKNFVRWETYDQHSSHIKECIESPPHDFGITGLQSGKPRAARLAAACPLNWLQETNGGFGMKCSMEHGNNRPKTVLEVEI
jgi:hypothetical protein